MKTWPQLKEMAPLGKILIDGQIVPVEVLIRGDYSDIVTEDTHQARNMVTKRIQFINQNDGSLVLNNIYDVYQFNHEEHCLNVYGARMLLDYIENIVPQEDKNEIRFNYTGLQ